MVCYLSEIGYGNFFYPSGTKAIINDYCEEVYEELNWLGGDSRNLKAVKVKNVCLFPIKLDEISTKEIILKDDAGYSVVWVKK